MKDIFSRLSALALDLDTDSSHMQSLAIQGVVPQCAVSPGSSEEVAAVLRLAEENDWVVVPSGGHTRQEVGGIPQRVDVVLQTRRIRAVEHYDPGDLTVGVGAGMTLAALQATLAPNHQFLPLDPANSAQSTVGGILACAAQGPMLAGFGGAREFCIGIRFVTASGKSVKGGGRVVKNVAGYDLMKLLIGSYGTLGVIVGASFKVFPHPRHTRTFVAGFASLREGIGFRDWLMNSGLAWLCLEVVSPAAQEYLRDSPVVGDVDDDVLADSAPPSSLPDSCQPETSLQQKGAQSADSWKVLLRASGSEAVFQRYQRELPAGTTQMHGEDETRTWQWISGFESGVIARHQNAMLVQMAVPLAMAEEAALAAESCALHHNFFAASTGRVSEGHWLCAFVPLAVDPPSAMQYAAVISELRGRLPAAASAWVLRCPREAKIHFDLWGPTTTDRAAMKAVKQALDPRDILNRGRFMV